MGAFPLDRSALLGTAPFLRFDLGTVPSSSADGRLRLGLNAIIRAKAFGVSSCDLLDQGGASRELADARLSSALRAVVNEVMRTSGSTL